jgi:hypothetical protein
MKLSKMTTAQKVALLLSGLVFLYKFFTANYGDLVQKVSYALGGTLIWMVVFLVISVVVCF